MTTLTHESQTMRPPIIIVGMHRSGTSMISRMLETFGLFMGTKKDPNNESLFFRDLNEWVLNSAGGAWDNPEAMQYLIENIALKSLTSDYLRHRFQGPGSVVYWGLRRLLRRTSTALTQKPWGWKDPRNTYTLPLWLDLFPQARVIHVVRHGIDVAQSLKVRNEASLINASLAHEKRKSLGALYHKKGRFIASTKVQSLPEGFLLWEQYVTQNRSAAAALGERWLEVKYEDFLSEPAAILSNLARFCDLSPGKDQLETVAKRADPSRAYAYRSNPTLMEFADTVSARLAAFGYE